MPARSASATAANSISPIACSVDRLRRAGVGLASPARARARDQLARAQQRGQRERDAVHRARLAARGALVGLLLLPRVRSARAPLDLRVAEHVRVAPHELVADRAHHVGEVEATRLARHLRVEHHLEQEIAELVAQAVPVLAADRVVDLVGLLDRVGRDRLEALLEVPRAAAARGSRSSRHDLEQAFDSSSYTTSSSGSARSPVARAIASA